ncbi:hypothetical protein N656DRAFT_784486 [Canariomyces notabilis]|uniref:Uncharacterized protein n=1 Tax=Canariomyces notabilis TaxID=2074819 RepID=A0AAN6QIS6_9PEZI|nr:hypothetical protein N656DRAFT_784486 [Canariomyces arenarius]
MEAVESCCEIYVENYSVGTSPPPFFDPKDFESLPPHQTFHLQLQPHQSINRFPTSKSIALYHSRTRERYRDLLQQKTIISRALNCSWCQSTSLTSSFLPQGRATDSDSDTATATATAIQQQRQRQRYSGNSRAASQANNADNHIANNIVASEGGQGAGQGAGQGTD